jgi:enoyl-CoA hydratase/carnithine racemase
MPYEKLLVKLGEDFVATLTLNRFEQMNAFASAFVAELNQTLRDLDADPRVRVVVLKGNGKAFYVGIEIKKMAGKSSPTQDHGGDMEPLLITMSRLAKPVIVAVDRAIVSDKARGGYTTGNVGLFLSGAGRVFYAHGVGRKRVPWSYCSTVSSPPRPEGPVDVLVNKVAPEEELDKETTRRCGGPPPVLAKKSHQAVQTSRNAFYAMAYLGYAAVEMMNEAFARLCSTTTAEGGQAFLEKGDPFWEER